MNGVSIGTMFPYTYNVKHVMPHTKPNNCNCLNIIKIKDFFSSFLPEMNKKKIREEDCTHIVYPYPFN